MATKIQAVRGMNDILPEQAPLWERFEDTVRHWLRTYGYRNLRTPVLERTELFVRSIGVATDIVEKEMYTFVDSLNGESLTLRPEGTASCVRAAVEHSLLYNAPQRLYYMGPMFRHERPQKGRYRQFHQVGVEALGFPGPDIDAEHIVMCGRLWRELGIEGVTLEINTLGSAEARARYRARLIEYLERHLDILDKDPDAKRRLHANPLRLLDSKNPELEGLIAQAPQLEDDLDTESSAHFEGVKSLLRDADIEFTHNRRLVRGLDYYNLTVFEWKTQQLGTQGTICAGGRYDGLIDQIGGKLAPACGFALGVERVLELMQAAGTPITAELTDVYLVHKGDTLGTAVSRFAFVVAERLRDTGLTVILHSNGGSFLSQMKKADASGARFAVIIGDGETNSRQVGVKSLRRIDAQRQCSVSEAAELIKLGRG